MQLSSENYYSLEADREYMSCSQFEDFLSCEAAAVAKIRGLYEPKKSKAFLVGNYFHTAFEGPEAHAAFKQQNYDDIYTKQGKLRADFERADMMIDAALSDEKIKQLADMPGENEKIMTGKLFGHYPWKIRLDKYIEKPRLIIDWKTVSNIRALEWNADEGTKVSFVRNFRYLFRAAVYIEIEKQYTGNDSDPAFWLACISKEDPPDKELVSLNHRQTLDFELEKVKEKIWRFSEIKAGRIMPKRCGKCPYCRSTKKIRSVISFFELDDPAAVEREDDYAL